MVPVIGVMPAGFHFVWPQTDFWGPLRVDPRRDYRAKPFVSVNIVGRLKPSITPDMAQTELETISGQLAQAHISNKGLSARIVPLREELTGDVKTSLWLLFAAVGVLLLIACSNFAGLLLARSAYRRSEMTLRAALGAGRATILRQCFAESVILALTGGTVGVIVAGTSLSTSRRSTGFEAFPAYVLSHAFPLHRSKMLRGFHGLKSVSSA